jgi:uncharacterized membrane protein HdeD (DUF308 family)
MTSQSQFPATQARLAEAFRRQWTTFLIEGIVLLILGAIAIIVPEVATLAVAILLGWLLLISGIVGLISTLRMRSAPGFIWSLISAILGIVVGGILIGWPVGGVISLTILMIVFFLIEGVTSILFALDHRRQLSGRWGIMLLSGIIDILLAAIILAGFPQSSAWVIGLLLGINLVFGGAALISMALAARQA